MIDFKTLKIWEISHEIALAVYKLTRSFPKEEIYGLTSQMRGSASSIPTNIAEGCGRGSDKDLSRFLQISMGSTNELEYQLILSKDLNYIKENEYVEYTEKLILLKKMLISFIKKVRERVKK